MAGSGKRADQLKTLLWKYRYAGKYGFVSKSSTKAAPINVSFIDDNLQSLIEQKKATADNGTYRVDLNKLGFTKLLGKGRVKNKYVINVGAATKKAVKVIEEAGGQVILTQKAKASKEKT